MCPEGVGHLSSPGLTFPPTGSYLTLPAVDLEALKAEFQDDGPASGRVLGGKELVGAGLPPRSTLTQPQHQSPHAGQSAPHTCQGAEP